MSISSSIGNGVQAGYNDISSVLNPTVTPSGNIGPSPTGNVGGVLNAISPKVVNSVSTPATSSPSTSGVSGGLTAAQLAAQGNYNNNLSAFNSGTQQAINTGAGDYGSGILSYFNGAGGINSQQNTINANAVQNELAKDQGLQGVTDMVNNGIQGGGVVLDNDNAGTSSAGDALARAYGVQGRQQASAVGNQYVQGQNSIANDQNNLNTAIKDFTTNVTPTKKNDTINSIVQTATQQIQQLNYIAQLGGLAPEDQLNIAQQQDAIRAQATAALSAFDHELTDEVSANQPTSQEANQAKAQGLFTAGTAAAQPFNFTSTAPATLQGTGPAASNLPIYIGQPNKNYNTSVPVTG